MSSPQVIEPPRSTFQCVTVAETMEGESDGIRITVSGQRAGRGRAAAAVRERRRAAWAMGGDGGRRVRAQAQAQAWAARREGSRLAARGNM